MCRSGLSHLITTDKTGKLDADHKSPCSLCTGFCVFTRFFHRIGKSRIATQRFVFLFCCAPVCNIDNALGEVYDSVALGLRHGNKRFQQDTRRIVKLVFFAKLRNEGIRRFFKHLPFTRSEPVFGHVELKTNKFQNFFGNFTVSTFNLR